jgi:hypothetical protein
MWKNFVELDRSQMTIWHMRIACWVPKTTNTHLGYAIFIAFPLQQWLYEVNMPECYVMCTLTALFNSSSVARVRLQIMKVTPVLLAFGIFQVTLPLEDGSLLTSEEQHLVYYLLDIVYQQFEAGRSVLISWPSDAPKETHTRHTPAPKPPNADIMNIVSFLLTTLNQITRWPLHISCVGGQIPEIIFDNFGKHHGYVIFMWAEEREADVTGHLIDQLEEMKISPLWNSQGRFLIMVTGHHSQNISHLAVDNAQELWNGYMISNVLLLIPKVGTKYLQSRQPLGLYTWIPYQSHKTCKS